MNRIMTLFASLALSCIMGASVSAQNGYEVKGVVVDAVGPVIGATVIEQGTENGTSTGLDGDYVLTVSSANAIVEVSCIGYASQTFVASQVPATITLTEDSEFLNEVVVIGYGTVKKEDMTGSVTAIKADELNRGAVVSTQDMLKGKVPGLHVIPGDGGPGSGSTIRIRGGASLNASNDPLIVIDGVPVAYGAGSGMANPLDLVNPNDIESFSVLKDASSAAIYGSRASNGVIIITTKKGKGNKPQVSYSGSVSIQQSDRIPTMNAAELKELYNNAYPEGTIMGDAIRKLYGDKNTDWQSEVLRLGVATDHNVSVYGNVKDRMPYRAAIGYQRHNGTIKTSAYDKGTLDLNLSPNFLDKHLTVDLSAKGVYSHQRYANSGALGKAAFYNPTIDPYWRNEDGSIDYTTTNGFWGPGAGRGDDFVPNNLLGEGPLSMLYDVNNKMNAIRFIGRAAVDYKVHGLESLRFNVSASMDLTDYNGYNGVNPGSWQAFNDSQSPKVGQYSKSNNLSKSETLEAYANYSETWGKHTFTALAGYSWQHNFWKNRSVTYFNESNEMNLIGGDEATKYPVYRNENYMVSFYGRLDYSYDSRYLVTFSLRGDGSSKFSKAARWGVFPSGAFAWNIKQEGFLKDVNSVSTLKLRLSAGMTGQQDKIGDYVHLAKYYDNSAATHHYYDMGGGNYMYFLAPNAYDPLIKWETTTTYNVGVDFGFFDERLYGTVDAYLRNTNDLLNNMFVPLGSNFSNNVLTNVGSIQNKGIEFSINAIPVQTKDWSVQVGFNGTVQDSKFTKLNSTDNDTYFVAVGNVDGGTGSMLSRHMVDYSPYTYFTYQQLYDTDGNPIQNAFVDRDKDGVISEGDRYMSGKSPIPTFFYGLNFKVQYKDWDFGFNGHGNADYWVFNNFASNHSTSYFNVNNGLLENQPYVVKKTGFTAPNAKEQAYSDMFLENASFFRLDDINLGYTFRNVGKWETEIRLAAAVQNVFVITKYSGVDPEVSSEDGIDKVAWPRPRTFSLRLNINF